MPHLSDLVIQLKLESHLLNRSSLASAILIGHECFPWESDRSLLERIYSSFATGNCLLESRTREDQLRVLPHYTYSIGQQPVAIGGLYLYESKPKRMYLSWLGVVSEKRRQGIGSAIVDQLTTLSRSLGAHVLSSLAASEMGVQSFYSNCGWTVGAEEGFLEEKLKRFDIALHAS